MRSRLRLFAIVGILATAVDVGLFLILVDPGDSALGIAAADVVALAAAAVVSYGLNRWITFRGEPDARWVRHPGAFAATAVMAGAADVLVVVTLMTVGAGAPVAKIIGVALAAVVRWTVYRWVLFSVVRRQLAERRPRPPAPGAKRLSVVIPAYNESEKIGSTVSALRSHLEPKAGERQVEIVVADDGSRDRTVPAAREAGARVVELDENRGKGAAVRAGVLAAEGRTIVFTDADLAYPPELVWSVLEQVEDGWDVVVGSRRHQDTTTLVRARRVRELGGWAINWLTHLVLLGHFRDTQCGIKGFRGDIGRTIFERTRIDGFAFDVEIFLIAEQDHLSLVEVPVSVQNRQGSSVRMISDSIRLLGDLAAIRRRAGRGEYRPDPAQGAVLDSSRRAATGPPVDRPIADG